MIFFFSVFSIFHFSISELSVFEILTPNVIVGKSFDWKMKKRENKYLYLWHLKVFVITQLYRPRDEEYKAEKLEKKNPKNYNHSSKSFPHPKKHKKTWEQHSGQRNQTQCKREWGILDLCNWMLKVFNFEQMESISLRNHHKMPILCQRESYSQVYLLFSLN